MLTFLQIRLKTMGLSIVFAPCLSNHGLITFHFPFCFCELLVPLAPTGSETLHSVMPRVINLWLLSTHLPQSECGAHSSRCPNN